MLRYMRYALSTMAVAAALLVAGGQAVQAAPAYAASTTVSVVAVEYKFTLSKSTVAHGTVTFKITKKGKIPHDFKITNKGKIPHDFKINGKKTPLIAPGKTATQTVTFAKAGKYAYSCTVPGHSTLGMKGTLKVT
jgi:uncharacterized cupredoxin-like copper-binding protein